MTSDTDTAAGPTDRAASPFDRSVTLTLRPADLELIVVGLHLLLDVEDDPQEIEQLKVLIARLAA